MDDIGSDIEVTTATGGMRSAMSDSNSHVYVITDNRDAVYVVLAQFGATLASADVVYIADDDFDRVGTDQYEYEVWFMATGESETVVLDENTYDAGEFYKVDSVDSDGVYSLAPISDFDGVVGNSSEGADRGLELDRDSDSVYNNTLTRTTGSATYRDVSFANAVVVDARPSLSGNDSYVYAREINSVSRLNDALEESALELDLYFIDGEIVFIAVVDADTESNPINPGGEGSGDFNRVVLAENGNVTFYDGNNQVNPGTDPYDWELYRYTANNGWQRYDHGDNYVYGQSNPWTMSDGYEYYVVIDGVESNRVDLTT